MTVENLPEPPPQTLTERAGQLRLGLAAAGDLRWAAVDVAGPTEEARRRLDLSPLAAVALGRTMAAAALLLRFYNKVPGRLLVEIVGDGPLGKVVAEVDHQGRMRGMVGEPRLPTPVDGSLVLGPAIGEGRFQVTRESEGARYTSQVELVTGEIATDLAHYLQQSQQIQSAALLGVLPRPDGIGAAGGLLVEALPGADEAAVSGLETTIAGLDGVSALLEEGGVEGLLEAVVGGLEPEELESHPLLYSCRCRREDLLQSLLTLASADLQAVVDDRGLCEAVCAFCGERYLYSSEELRPS